MDMTRYDHGTPSWIDMTAPDVDAAKTFYRSLFGWSAEDQTDPEGNYIYTLFKKDGKNVSGLGPQQEGMAGMPAIWNSYVNVDDAEQITKAAEAAGGTVIVPPMQVMDSGSMAFFADPTGAAIGVWQPANHIGAEVVNEPDTYSWNELMSRDLDTAKAFYNEVFGWEYATQEMPNGPYTVIQGGENGGLGGMMDMPAEMPEQVPNYWSVYFLVEDAEASTAKAVELGANVNMPVREFPGVGKISALADPQGGSFSLMEPAPLD